MQYYFFKFEAHPLCNTYTMNITVLPLFTNRVLLLGL